MIVDWECAVLVSQMQSYGIIICVLPYRTDMESKRAALTINRSLQTHISEIRSLRKRTRCHPGPGSNISQFKLKNLQYMHNHPLGIVRHKILLYFTTREAKERYETTYQK